MRLRSIWLRNWMCFGGDVSIENLPASPIAVVARFEDDRERSNWGGKTALLEAIRWAILGVHRKRTDDGIIFHGAATAVVELVFDGELPLSVRRSRPRGGPTLLEVVPAGRAGGALTRDAAEEELLRVFRLSSEDFDNTLWWGQGDTEALVGETSGVRRAIVGRWLELELWERLGKRASKFLGTSRDELERSRASLAGLDRGRTRSEIEREASVESEKLARLTVEVDALTASLQRYSVDDAKERKAAEVGRMEVELQEAARRATHARQAVAAGMAATVEREELARLTEAWDEVRAKHGAAGEEKRRALAVVSDGFDGTCPVTRSACPAADEVREQDAAIRRRANEASSAFAVVAKEHEAIRYRLEAARTAAATVARDRSRMEEAIAASKALSARLEAARTELAEMPEPERLDPTATSRLASLRVERDRLQVRTGALGQELREAKRRDEGIAEQKAVLAQRESDARAALLAARALGPTGIPAKIAAEQLHSLERRANALLAGVGLSFAFAWQRELQEVAPDCRECGFTYEKRARQKECPSCGAPRGNKRSDELDIVVDDRSAELEDARAKSGGAKVLIASAIRLAASTMIRERRGSPLAVAIVDEPFGPLDAANRRLLARTFGSMLGSVGLEQAFVVSHDESLLAALPARIVVVRSGRSSTATLEA